MLRIGIIGCGGIAPAHVHGWNALPGRAKIVAVADPDSAARRRVIATIPNDSREAAGRAIREYDDVHALLTEAKPDAVDILLPHHLHKEAILAACRRGAHWLCEKPLCLSLDEAEEIAQAMRTARVTGMCAHNQVFMPALCEAKRMLNAGAVGEIYTIISQDCFIMGLAPAGSLPDAQARSPLDAGTWRSDRTRMGGGELIDTGYHPSYRLLFLAGETPTDVVAITGRYRLKQMDGEDTATLLCRFASGATGEVRTSWAMDVPSGHHVFHVIGERGELYGGADTLCFKPNRMQPATMTLPAVDTFAAEIEHFVTCLETNRRPIQTHEDGIAVLRMITQAYDFARSRGMPL